MNPFPRRTPIAEFRRPLTLRRGAKIALAVCAAAVVFVVTGSLNQLSAAPVQADGDQVNDDGAARSDFDPFAEDENSPTANARSLAEPDGARLLSSRTDRSLPSWPSDRLAALRGSSPRDHDHVDAAWPGGGALPSSWPSDALRHSQYCVDCEYASCIDSEWQWRLFPRGLIYTSYLAGVKESRFATVWFHDEDWGWQWDSTLGGRVGLVRFGTGDEFPFYPQGWQLDVEGAGMPRLDMVDGRRDLVASDFRVGVPLTYAQRRYQMKLAYYHLSSHLGDEFILRTGGTRLNFVRDVIVWGHSYYATDTLRTYAEVGYAIHTDGGSEPWEFQFGFDCAPACPTGFMGAPFLAANAHLREEFDFGGNAVAQLGWAWRERRGGPLARVGLQYYNGKSNQYQFISTYEEQWGIGMWYDY